jgi:predicted HTH transcriptional regulator
MALDSLLGRGLVRVHGVRRGKQYSVVVGASVTPPVEGVRDHEEEHQEDPIESRCRPEWSGISTTAIVDALDVNLARSSEDLQKVVGVGATELRVQLARLVADGTVVKIGRRRGTRYLLSDGRQGHERLLSAGHVDAGSLERSHIASDGIMAALHPRVGRTSEELQGALRVGATELRAALVGLLAAGAITKTGQRRGTRYLLAEGRTEGDALRVQPRDDAPSGSQTPRKTGQRQLALFD